VTPRRDLFPSLYAVGRKRLQFPGRRIIVDAGEAKRRGSTGAESWSVGYA